MSDVHAEMFAVREESGRFTRVFGSRVQVAMSTFRREHQNIVKVIVREAREDEQSPYWGWVESGSTKPTMIWPSKIQSDMCFPYGLKAAEEAGKGRQVNLVVEELQE